MTNFEYLKTMEAKAVANLIFPTIDDASCCEVFLDGTKDECEGICSDCMAAWLRRERVDK